MAASGNLRRRRTVGVVEDAGDLNRPARVGAKEVPAWSWDLSLSHDGRDSLTMTSFRKRGKGEGGREEEKRGKSGRSEEEEQEESVYFVIAAHNLSSPRQTDWHLTRPSQSFYLRGPSYIPTT